MSKKTRRHIWPVALVAVLAVAGLMASLIVLASPPGTAQAQSVCDSFTGPALEALLESGVCPEDDGTDPGNGTGTPATATATTRLLARCSIPAAAPAALPSSSP